MLPGRKYLREALIRNGGIVKYERTRERKRALQEHEEWLREKFFRHAGNADVIRQELKSEKGVTVSLRTVERAVRLYREELRREASVTVRFETPPGRQMQIDFGEKKVLIGGERVHVHFFVAKLGYSRRLYDIKAFEHENQDTWFQGMEGAFAYFGGVPAEVLTDNPRALVTEHNRVTRELKLNERLRRLRSTGAFYPVRAPRSELGRRARWRMAWDTSRGTALRAGWAVAPNRRNLACGFEDFHCP